MNIADNLNRIIQAKSDIKTAIEKKGVDVGDITIDKYAEKIDLIEQGGGSGGRKKIMNSLSLSNSTFTEFDGSNWDWSQVRDAAHIFSNCDNLQTVTGLNLKPVACFEMFAGCGNLISVDLSMCDFSDTCEFMQMFDFCNMLTEVKFGGPINININTTNMFRYVYTTGTLYYPKEYDYTPIINALPSKWTAVAY